MVMDSRLSVVGRRAKGGRGGEGETVVSMEQLSVFEGSRQSPLTSVVV